jgi:hypothetical protein
MGNNEGYCISRAHDPIKYRALEVDDGLGNFNMHGADRGELTDFEK